MPPPPVQISAVGAREEIGALLSGIPREAVPGRRAIFGAPREPLCAPSGFASNSYAFRYPIPFAFWLGRLRRVACLTKCSSNSSYKNGASKIQGWRSTVLPTGSPTGAAGRRVPALPQSNSAQNPSQNAAVLH